MVAVKTMRAGVTIRRPTRFGWLPVFSLPSLWTGLCMVLCPLWMAVSVSAAAATPDPMAAAAQLARVKDVASIEGIRDNQLVGYGLVVGLHGTGDSQQTVFPAQTLVSTLERMGVTVPQSGAQSAANMQVKNMAGVFVVATMPPFCTPGYKLDVTVSSAGDARSLEGGILLMTPLYGPDGQIFAQAQGGLVLGGYSVTAGGNTRQMNHPTTARIPNGALVEKAVPFNLDQLHTIDVVLNDADFHTAEGTAMAIDKVLGADRAHAMDSRRIEVMPEPGEDVPALLDKIESAQIEVYPRARVVVNERTGTVVIGGTVRLQPVSILHGGLSVNVIAQTQVSQPGPFSTGTTQVVQQTTVQAEDKPVNRIDLKEGATVEDLVQELQRTGAGARDVISILQAMKQAGALEADLEVL
ncbi:MAG TPA: flagellar basal body P-ring protein FlgI [Terracidiphilus sp.]|jgi:flagellar P-ring protein precursor FlgI|nr:flagellar basal body P-ring protein FlgI [Terracidiphilus sp.]